MSKIYLSIYLVVCSISLCFSHALDPASFAPLQQTFEARWIDHKGVTENNGALTKTATGQAWYSGANSSNLLPSNTDGWIEFTANDVTANFAIGFADVNHIDLSKLNYGIRITSTNLTVYELSQTGSFGTATVNSVYRIAREGSSIKYYKDGTLFKTSTTNPALTLHVMAVVSVSKPIPVVHSSFDANIIVNTVINGTVGSSAAGAIQATAMGGKAPYTYAWDTGETTSSIQNKPFGEYTLTVTDADGRTKIQSCNIGYAIDWTDEKNATNNNGVLTKTGGSVGSWDAGALSSNVMDANTDGWLEFVASFATKQYFFGFSNRRNFSTTDFYRAIYISANGAVAIYEGATSIPAGTWQTGDVFRIARIGNLIKYYRNGIEIRSIASDPLLELTTNALLSAYGESLPLVNASFDANIVVYPEVTGTDATGLGGSIVLNTSTDTPPYTFTWSTGETTNAINNKPVGTYTVQIADAAGRSKTLSISIGYKSHYTLIEGLTPSGDDLQCNVEGWGNSGAVSTNILPANTDGWLEFTANSKFIAEIGFAYSYVNNLDYFTNGIYLSGVIGHSNLREGTATVSMSYRYYTGDIFRIERVGSFIKYYKNGQFLRQVGTNPSYELKLKVIMFKIGDVLPAVQCSHDAKLWVSAAVKGDGYATNPGSIIVAPMSGKPPYTYTWTQDTSPNVISTSISLGNLQPAKYTVNIQDAESRSFTRSYTFGSNPFWTNLTNVVQSEGVLTKTLATAAWDAGAMGSVALGANTNGYFEFTISNAKDAFILGFATTNLTGYGLTSFTSGMRVENGMLYSVEGTTTTTLTPFSPGDVLRVAREASQIKYYRNGFVLRTIAATASAVLNVKASIYRRDSKTSLMNASFWIPAAQGIIPDIAEFDVLKELYASLSGPSWTTKTNWPTDWTTPATLAQMATWHGITVTNGDITGINLTANNLVGPIPSSINQLAGLTDLNLSGNNISGDLPDLSALVNVVNLSLGTTGEYSPGPLPTWLNEMTKLKKLNLSLTNRTGEIPASITTLTTLEELNLANNQLTGEIPSNINLLINLKQLDLSTNQLESTLPIEIKKLSNLTFLSLANNQLLGSLPDSLSKLTALQVLRLDSNHFLGSIPTGWTALLALQELSLHHNRLSGSVPKAFATFANLSKLYLHDNELAGFGDFSTAVNKANLTITVQNNNLGFAELEPNFTSPGVHVFQSFTFAPQEPIGSPANIRLALRTPLMLRALSHGLHGTTTWLKQNGSNWGDITAQNQETAPDTFLINNIAKQHEGVYKYSSTNSWIPGLTIECASITVTTYDAAREALDQWAFQYRHDDRGRLVEKKIPGADWTYFILDERDRRVMTQDGNQRLHRQWTFTKYDALNRVVMTGLYTETDTTITTREAMQQKVNDFYVQHPDAFAEARGTDVHGYTNRSFPQIAADSAYYAIFFYDDYSFTSLLGNTSLDFVDNELPAVATQGDQPQQIGQEISPSIFVATAPTGEKTKLTNSNTWLWSATYFDDKERTIQHVAQNHKGGLDRTTNVLDFSGKLLRTATKHTFPEKETINIASRYRYDHAGRVIDSYRKVNDHDEVLLSQLAYNELGQVVTKKLHATGPSQFKQHVDFRYNIRGWLTRINNADLNTGDGGPKDFFGMEFGYQNDLGVGTFTPQYNGNISAAKWSANFGFATGEMDSQRAYKFEYDPMARVTKSAYATRKEQWTSSEAFLEEVDYDQNGNIKSLTRTNGSGQIIDDLVYEYGSGKFRSNRLRSTVDYASEKGGFNDKNKQSLDYGYDANGNLISDLNKEITEIKFNSYLDQTEEVIQDNGQRIRSTYDANGLKLTEETFEKDSTIATKRADFIGALVFESDTLQFISHPEGKIVVADSIDGELEYQYQIKDNVNNVRLTFTTKVDVDSYLATMEDNGMADVSNPRIQEMELFENLFESEGLNVSQWLNHTSNASGNAIYLDGSEERAVGPYMLLKVNPGDTVKMKVYGKFQLQTSYNNSIGAAALMAIMAHPASLSANPGEGPPMSEGDFADPLAALMNGKSQDPSRPHADLNYIFFDKDFNVIDFDYDRMSAAAGFDEGYEYTVDFDSMMLSKIADRFGYLYIYATNETPGSKVWMDDLTIMHSHSPIIQAEDYYAFGLSIGETAFSSKDPNYAGSVTTDGLGLKDIGFRQYDPALGRFHAVDPLAEREFELSSYQYAGNNPVSLIDVLGLSLPGQVGGAGWDAMNGGSEHELASYNDRVKSDDSFSQTEVGNGKKASESKTRGQRKEKRQHRRAERKQRRENRRNPERKPRYERDREAADWLGDRKKDEKHKKNDTKDNGSNHVSGSHLAATLKMEVMEIPKFGRADEPSDLSDGPADTSSPRGAFSYAQSTGSNGGSEPSQGNGLENVSERQRRKSFGDSKHSTNYTIAAYSEQRAGDQSAPMTVNADSRAKAAASASASIGSKSGAENPNNDDKQGLDNMLKDIKASHPNPGTYEFDIENYESDFDFNVGAKKYSALVTTTSSDEPVSVKTQVRPKIMIVTDPFAHISISFETEDDETFTIVVKDVGTAKEVLKEMGFDDNLEKTEEQITNQIRKELAKKSPDLGEVRKFMDLLRTSDHSDTQNIDESDAQNLDDLTPSERASIIWLIATTKDIFDSNDEEDILDLINSTKEADAKGLIELFEYSKFGSQTLLSRIARKTSDYNPFMSDGNYAKLSLSLFSLFHKAVDSGMLQPQSNSNNGGTNDVAFRIGGRYEHPENYKPETPYIRVDTHPRLNTDGSVTMIRQPEQASASFGTTVYHPVGERKEYSWSGALSQGVYVSPDKDSPLYDGGRPVLIPVVLIPMAADEKLNEHLKKQIEVATDAGLLLVGVGELAGATRVGYLLGLLELGASSTSLVLKAKEAELRNALGDEAFKTLKTCASVIEMGAGGISALRSIPSLLTLTKPKFDNLTNVIKNSDYLDGVKNAEKHAVLLAVEGGNQLHGAQKTADVINDFPSNAKQVCSKFDDGMVLSENAIKEGANSVAVFERRIVNGKEEIVEVAKISKQVDGSAVVEISDPAMLNKLGTPQKVDNFSKDALDNSNLLDATADNPALVEPWKKMDDLVESGDVGLSTAKKDPKFLEQFDAITKDSHISKHVFEGEVKPVIDVKTGLQKISDNGNKMWTVSGVHSKQALDPDKLRIKPNTTVEQLPKGFYRAKVEAKIEAFTGEPYTNSGGWKVKDEKSTFFPDAWTQEKIQAEIAYALENKVIERGNKYRGTMSDGTPLVIFFQKNGEIGTVYPDL